MKKLPFIITLIGIATCFNTVYGQSFVADDTKLYNITFRGDYATFDFSLYESYRTGFQDAKSNGKDIKDNKKYKRIDFIYAGKNLYSTDVKYKTGNWNGHFPNCNKYYASNGQLYYDYDINNQNKLRNPMYYENGRFWNGIVEDAEDPGVYRFVVLDPDGNKLFDKPINPLSSYYGIDKKHPKYGSHYVHYVPAKNPSYYTPITDKNDSYYGYDHVGSYYNYEKDLELTGFFYPTKKMMANASVLFMEDKMAKKYYWAVIIDNEVKFKTEARADEKPDVLQLKKQTDFEVYSQDIATLVSHNIKTLNGYGVNMVPQDNKKPGDGIFLEVGQFKNGKLHGVGYRTKMMKDGGYHGLWDVDADYGLFENGQPVTTKHIFANKVKNDNNIWDVVPIEGFSYMGDKAVKGELYSDYYKVKTDKLKAGDEVYIESIKRTAKIKSVNNTGKYITVFTDDPKTQARLDINSGKIYVKNTFMGKNYQGCDPTVRVPVYKEEQQFAYTDPGKFTSNTYTVKGVYYDKVVTQSSYTPARNVYKKVRYIDGYTEKTCPICNGTGIIDKGAIEKAFWKPVQFD